MQSLEGWLIQLRPEMTVDMEHDEERIAGDTHLH